MGDDKSRASGKVIDGSELVLLESFMDRKVMETVRRQSVRWVSYLVGALAILLFGLYSYLAGHEQEVARATVRMELREVIASREDDIQMMRRMVASLEDEVYRLAESLKEQQKEEAVSIGELRYELTKTKLLTDDLTEEFANFRNQLSNVEERLHGVIEAVMPAATEEEKP